jgi:hypothetical protein
MIIGICGLIGSGKGTVADILVDEHGFRKISFADSLKDAISNVFGWPRNLLEGDTEESREFRERVDPWWAERLDIPDLTPRWILQQWGTEVCRNSFHSDIWILSLERKLVMGDGNVVIPDTRFPNEIDMIQKLGGQVWHVKRDEDPDWFTRYRTRGMIPPDIHPSEWAWARAEFDQTITNDGSLDDLRQKVLASIS